MDINQLVSLGDQALRDTVDEAGGLFPPSIYYSFFRRLAGELKPKVSVVLGVCGGGDCLHLCLGNPEGKVLGVDIAYDHPEQLEYIKANCPNFEFILGDSVASAKEIVEKYGKVDFLFVDTTHFKDQTVAEWEAWKTCVAPGGVVAFDDIFREGMQEFWDTLPEPKVRMDYLHDGTYPHGGGFGVLIMSDLHGYAEAVKAPDYEVGN